MMRFSRLAKFHKNQSGISLIEAVLVFFMLATLLAGMIEFKQAFVIKKRLDNAAHSLAQIVSSVDSMTSQEVSDLKFVVSEYLKPFNLKSGASVPGITITSVTIDDKDDKVVDWSVAPSPDGANGYAVGSNFPHTFVTDTANKSYIVVEISYVYQSIIGFNISNLTMRQMYSVPTRGSQVTLENS